MESPLTLVDVGVIVVVLASALFALMRGAVLEMLSIVGWTAAAVAAYFSWPWIGGLVQPMIGSTEDGKTGMLASIVGTAGVFLVVLAVMGVINHLIGQRIRNSAFSMADRSVGFAFGLIRGALLLCFAFVLIDAIWARPHSGEEDRRPEMIKNARFLPLLEAGADTIRGALPAPMQIDGGTPEPQQVDIGRPPSSMDQLLDDNLRRDGTGNGSAAAPVQTAPSVPPTATQPQPRSFVPPTSLPPPAQNGTQNGTQGDAGDRQGYRRSDRSGLDRLMENNE